jgi:hypothetical protein
VLDPDMLDGSSTLRLGGRAVKAVTSVAERPILRRKRANARGARWQMEPDVQLEKGEAQLSPLPNLLKLRDGYRVYHPDGLPPGAMIEAIGKIENDPTSLRVGLVLAASLAGASGLPFLVGAGEFWLIVASILGGFVGGIVLVWVPAAVVDGRTAGDQRRRRGGAAAAYQVVRRGDLRAARLCELADDVAATVSWREGIIDPDRRIPTTLWAAVERATRLSKLETRLRESEARGVAEAASEPLRRDVHALHAELARIEANLSEIFGIAHGLDAKMVGGIAARGAGDAPGAASTDVDYSDDVLAHGRALRDLL